MQVHFGHDLLVVEWVRSVACIGTFDGIHLGHREVIGKALEIGYERSLPTVVVTFDRHPTAVLAPERLPKPIASLATNLAVLKELGVALTLVLPFTPELAATSADDFFDHIMRGKVKAEAIAVGHDFAFGHDRVGTPEWLSKRIATEVVPPFILDGRRVSSSAIRSAVGEGDLVLAAKLLGRPFTIEGAVVHGAQLGRKLGYPTANLARSFDQLLPSDGVYAGEARTRRGTFRAAVSIGGRPTIDATSRTIEAYLLDYKGESLYGSTIELDLWRKLRDQVKFDDLESLKEQMAHDVAAVRG